VRRRAFIVIFGCAAAVWAQVAHAQRPAVPVVGFLNLESYEGLQYLVAAFRQGLREAGYVEGQNVAIEYRWAEGKVDRLPKLVDDLVRRRVAVIAVGGGGPARHAVKEATAARPNERPPSVIGAECTAIVHELLRPQLAASASCDDSNAEPLGREVATRSGRLSSSEAVGESG
jgi:hypothetical protein